MQAFSACVDTIHVLHIENIKKRDTPCDIVNSSKQTFTKGVSRMNSITQVMKFRRSMVEYALKHGVTKTAIKYNTYRQYVYRWLRRYDGSLESLRNKSRRPKHLPKAHTGAELKLIQDMRRRNQRPGWWFLGKAPSAWI